MSSFKGTRIVAKMGKRRALTFVDPTMGIFLNILPISRCADRRCQVHPYMVTNKLWSRIGMTYRTGSHLCIPCLEKWLGRALTRRDLMRDAAVSPINAWMHWRRGRLVLLSPRDAWAVIRKNWSSGRDGARMATKGRRRVRSRRDINLGSRATHRTCGAHCCEALHSIARPAAPAPRRRARTMRSNAAGGS